MKAEWKRFLLQWILPLGVFGIVVTFVFALFAANIKQETISSYESDIIVRTNEDATAINTSIKELESVAEAMIDVINSNNLTGFGATDVLEPMVRYSEAYLAVMVTSNDKATTDFARTFSATELSYYEDALNLQNKGMIYVNDDEILNSSAIVIKMKVGDEADSFVLLYYPLGVNEVKSLIEIGKSIEAPSSCHIIDAQGKIITSVIAGSGFEPQTDYWSDVSVGNNAAVVKRAKTKAMSKVPGSFEATINGVECLVTYSTIPGTSFILLENYKKANAEQIEVKQLLSSYSRLRWTAFVFGVFAVIVTIINVASIFATSKGNDELKDKADRDLLTGLKNKIATEREIKEYMEDHPDSLGVMFLVDIDNFKKINDTMGHAFGDEVLRELGKNIGINFRVSDVIGRTGGDEFMIFLKNLKEDANTLREAQKLIYFFRHFQVGDYVKYSVTASIGAAVFPDHGTDFESLYKSADAAVYKSKKRGKNQLSFYDDRDRTPEEVAEADSHLIDIERKEETPIES